MVGDDLALNTATAAVPRRPPRRCQSERHQQTALEMKGRRGRWSDRKW